MPTTASEALTILEALRAELELHVRVGMGARAGHVSLWLFDVGQAITRLEQDDEKTEEE